VGKALTIGGWLRWELIRRLIPPDAESVLEIGVGRGALGRRLARKYAAYVGAEIDPTSFEIARPDIEANGGLLVRTIDDLDEDRIFDLLCAFEVLEHMEDDREELRHWSTRVRPGGHLLLSVPAHPERFGPIDVRTGHYRRYTRAGLQQVFHDAGFEDVVVWGYGWPLLYLLERIRISIAARQDKSELPIEQRTCESGRFLHAPDWLAPATMAVAAPFRLLQLPLRKSDVGIGWVARARRPGASPA
jgi:SAM-dependent methyltransferase